MSEESEKKSRKFHQKPAFIFFVITLVLAGLAGLTYYFATRTAAPAVVGVEDEVKATVTAVGKLMDLPTDETPTVASVSDVTKLTNQPFFVKAANGDKVLIYNNKKQAILYRPSTDKIIEVAPINVTASTPVPTISGAVTTTPSAAGGIKIALYNGARVNGLSRQYEKELLTAVSSANVVVRDNAKNEYGTTFLVDIRGNKQEAAKIAADLKIKVQPMPSGESSPSADFLIVIGKDKAPSVTPSPTP